MNINYLAYDPFLDSIEYLHMLQEQQDYQKVAQQGFLVAHLVI